MKSLFGKFILLALIPVALFSCVSQQKYKELSDRCMYDKNALSAKVDELTKSLEKSNLDLQQYKNDNTKLRTDTTRQGEALRINWENYEELLHAYDLLKAQNSGNKSEVDRVMSELSKREENIRSMQTELDSRAKKLDDLQAALKRNDSITNAMRRAVSDALVGFEGKGLTIQNKNGKVYVSMDEKLLFASGKWEVGTDGTTALRNLSTVLATNPDINVLIEGHTDNVPFKGTGQVKDNWDLSVVRATAIVKILTENPGINPIRLTAAGRSEYLPVDPDNSVSARAKNRRTEIILSPKLDALMQIIEKP